MSIKHIYLPLISLCIWLVCAPFQAYAGDGQFPPLQGELLSGDEVTFPTQFTSSTYMVIMSFDRDQEAQIESWIKARRALPKDIMLFEVALIGEVGGIARFFIKGGMRDMDQYKSRKEAVMPYFGDAERVKSQLNVTDSSQVHAFLITKEGQILWQDKGDYKNQYRQLPDLNS